MSHEFYYACALMFLFSVSHIIVVSRACLSLIFLFNFGKSKGIFGLVYSVHLYAGHLIGCDKKSEIVRYFPGILCDKIGLLCNKLCDFLEVISIVLPSFKGEKSL